MEFIRGLYLGAGKAQWSRNSTADMSRAVSNIYDVNPIEYLCLDAPSLEGGFRETLLESVI